MKITLQTILFTENTILNRFIINIYSCNHKPRN
nr:MAG TPA: hypothetical protein [Caudoviricetes sp.]